MKNLLIVLTILLASVCSYGQNFDYALNKTEQSEYTSSTRIMTVFQFASTTPLPNTKKFEIIKSLELKPEIKSVAFNSANTILTVEVVKGIDEDDLNNVLNEYGVLLITDSTPKELVDKIQHQASMH